ncbi:60S acidic ribosomal protein P2 [Auxenochlorella protothecoides]|uniref:60S acidic ribosomal protein P2 n=2 Tax=Auxenochlorella protothecoides TaxID=3075 RepID=A0A087S9K0_AUXPR|nr:60S acidic ribosomal protein P2 [Auxenochlorella protothecoides]KFM22404.1 60S acidic ribosomal protein P2 [Auxenochlorella protothecoides]RMZ55641.1 hypothetical protein APUTEX25_000224 [Auxenochlorella protothecoides]|eukprot:RMZ55641.1 hypothetical protein APUTEX25_000224 [Auxenochlorella protothecoides]
MVKVVAAYLLAALGGNATPSAEDISKILSSVGIEADSERVATLLKEVDGKDINEIVASGLSKLASVPAGGAAPSAGGASAGAAAAEAPKEEAKKEESEEEDAVSGNAML